MNFKKLLYFIKALYIFASDACDVASHTKRRYNELLEILVVCVVVVGAS